MDAILEYLNAQVIWFIVGFVMLIMEMLLPGLIIFFFGIGAWITAMVCWLVPMGINMQLGLFIVSSVLLLVVLRGWLKGVFYGHSERRQRLTEPFENEGIGKHVTVIEPIAPNRPGKVELYGSQWEAQADQEIRAGDTVEIVAKENLKLTVRKV